MKVLTLSRVFPRLRNNFLETFEGQLSSRDGLRWHQVARSDEKLTAFLELERITHGLAFSALLNDDDN